MGIEKFILGSIIYCVLIGVTYSIIELFYNGSESKSEKEFCVWLSILWPIAILTFIIFGGAFLVADLSHKLCKFIFSGLKELFKDKER